MKPATKPILWLVVALIGIPLLLLSIAIAVLTQIDPNAYKDRVMQSISQKTGLTVNIGDIRWSFFPWLGMQASDISLQNPQLTTNDSARQLLRMDKADIKIKVIPLFSGKVEIGTLRFDRPHVIYQLDGDSRSNWQLSGKLEQPNAQAISNTSANTSSNTSGNSAAPPFNMIDVESLVIDQATIHFKDAMQHWQIEPLNLTIQNIRIQNQILLQPVDIQLEARAQDQSPTKSEINIALNSPLSLEIPQQDWSKLIAQLSPLSLKLSYQDLSYPQGIKATLDSNLLIDLGKNQSTLNKIQMDVAGARVSGNATVSSLTQQPQVSSDLVLEPLNLANWLQQNLQISLGFPKDRLKEVSFNGAIKTQGKRLSIQPLRLQVDESAISGDVLIHDLEQQTVQTNLKIDRLNLDQYFPQAPIPAAISTPVETTGNTAADSQLFPVEMLRTLDIQADVSIAQLKYRNIDVQNTQVKLNARKGLLTLDQLQANLLQGSVQATGQLDVRGAVPKLLIKPKVKQLQLQPLLTALEQKPMLTGEISLNGEATTQGQTITQLTQGLISQMNVNIDKGALKTINIFQKIQEGLDNLAPIMSTIAPNKTIPKLPAALVTDDTQFKQLIASATIQNGIVTTQKINIGLDQAQLQGDTNWSLINNQGDLHFQVTLDKQLVDEKLTALQWPVNCQVNLTSVPKCALDLAPVRQQLQHLITSTAKDTAKQKLNEAINKKLGLATDANAETAVKESAESSLKQQENEVKDKAEEKINKALNNLFK